MLTVPLYNMQKVWYSANRDIIYNTMIRKRKINFEFIYQNWLISHSTKKFIDQSYENRYYDVWIKPIEKTSVADPRFFGHFGVDPDPNLNSRIHASDKWIRKSNIRHKAVENKVFLFFFACWFGSATLEKPIEMWNIVKFGNHLRLFIFPILNLYWGLSSALLWRTDRNLLLLQKKPLTKYIWEFRDQFSRLRIL